MLGRAGAPHDDERSHRCGGGATLIVSGAIADATTAAALNIRTGAAGLVELSAANTYGGATNLIAGNLRIAGADNRLPIGSTLNVGNSGNQDFATFDLNGFNQTVGGLISPDRYDADDDYQHRCLVNLYREQQ